MSPSYWEQPASEAVVKGMRCECADASKNYYSSGREKVRIIIQTMQRHIKNIARVARVHRSGRARGEAALPCMYGPSRGAQAGASGSEGPAEGMDTTTGVDEGALSAEEAAPAAEYQPQPKRRATVPTLLQRRRSP